MDREAEFTSACCAQALLSGDFELFVAEVGDQLEGAVERGVSENHQSRRIR